MWLLLFKIGRKTNILWNAAPTYARGAAQTAAVFVGTNMAAVVADVAAATIATASATAVVADLAAVVTDTNSVTATAPIY